MSAQLGDEASSGNNAEEIEREHQLQLQQQSKAKRRKVAGVVCGVPLGLFVLGLLTGVIEIVADVQVETCAEISDRLLCQASKAECCYNGITNNCTDLADCDPVCGPGFESYDNLGVEPCVACEPGWADTDEDPTTPCDICHPGTFAGSQSIECALCDGGTADTDEDAATLCAPGCLFCTGWSMPLCRAEISVRLLTAVYPTTQMRSVQLRDGSQGNRREHRCHSL